MKEPIMSKRLGIAFGLLALVLVKTGFAMAEDVKIGVMDMQRALTSVDAGKKARSTLEKEFNSRKKEIQNEENAFKKLDEEFKKQALVLNDEARQKKQSELQEKYMKLQEKVSRSQQEIQAKEHELTEPIIVKLKEIVKETAKKRNLSVVLEKNENTVLFSQEKDDLTEEVISTYNKNNKS